jgi:hypothetical protein
MAQSLWTWCGASITFRQRIQRDGSGAEAEHAELNHWMLAAAAAFGVTIVLVIPAERRIQS